MAKRKTTDEKIDELATAVNQGFNEVVRRLHNVEGRLNETATLADLAGVEERVIQRIGILEHRVLTEHATRLDLLEDNVRQIKTKLGIEP